MIQREISELRRHMTPERTNMTHIYGCYVNGEKQIIYLRLLRQRRETDHLLL